MSDIDCIEFDYDNEGNVDFLSVFDVKELSENCKTMDDLGLSVNRQLGNNVKVYEALANSLDVPAFILFFQINTGVFIAVSINDICDGIFEHLTNIPGDKFTKFDGLVDGKTSISFFESKNKLKKYYTTIDKDALNKLLKKQPDVLGLKTLNEFIIALR